MKHKQEEYWRPHFHAPPLRSHPDPPPTIQCSWYPHEGQCPYHGTLTLDELMRNDPAESYQQEQEMQMM